MTIHRLPKALLAYGCIRMPLALLELPLYLLLPAFYQQRTGANLAMIGLVLMATRLFDAIADPLIGQLIDRWQHRMDSRRWVWLGLPLLTLGFILMFLPPSDPQLALVWLAASSLLTCLAYSVVSIAYQAWGATIGSGPAQRARVTGIREAFGLVGVMLASALLSPTQTDWLLIVYLSLVAVCAFASLHAPRPAAPDKSAEAQDSAVQDARAGRVGLKGSLGAWRPILANRDFRWLLAVFMLNGIATAIPATLALFFMQDVLGATGHWPQIFLACYFLAGAVGMPLWIRLAGKFGLRISWLLGMSFAALAFIWALGLGQGDLWQFLAICLITGLALGSDLALPAALLAETIARRSTDRGREGSYFGVWTLATKLNLAIAAGIALPVLTWLGFTPGQPDQDTLALSLAYAAIPCALKLAAALLLLLSPGQLLDVGVQSTSARPSRPATPSAQGISR